MTANVWYAAYGSNLSPERFAHYLAGGRPDGALRTHTGCRNPAAPSDIRRVRLPGRVFFAAFSPVWGGGMAFYDPNGSGPSYATAYRLTDEQFADVWSQECHRPVGAVVPVERIAQGAEWIGGAGRYDRLLLVGWLDGEPMLTFTFAGQPPERNPPAPAYAATIERGLVQLHGLADEHAATYVSALVSSPSRSSSR